MQGAPRVPTSGTQFPDGALALTWDDGPDRATLELAKYLHSEHISGTFFVVGDWVNGLSEEPGTGDVHGKTGYDHLPVLDELVRLGHRLGSHTRHHILLDRAPPQTVAEELGAGLRDLAPHTSNEQKIFRAPGGAWSESASDALTDPYFADALGPIHWDIDGKDWEGSLYCKVTPEERCEKGPLPGRMRVHYASIARRYVSIANRLRRGIVLLHDRVGDVGSRYALDLAHTLIPLLKAQGFVFTAPTLAFGPLQPRHKHAVSMDDGREVGAAQGPHFADLDGDGRPDRCVVDASLELSCALATETGFRPSTRWKLELDRDAEPMLRFGDLNGDGRSDVCIHGRSEVRCALSTGRDFLDATVWHKGGLRAPVLVDVNGDGRADLCTREMAELKCGLAP
jgi:peptidoglycan/xylan/chitin deacetylase (PgdA/CDA1 family)